jgi:hypothetical protein
VSVTCQFIACAMTKHVRVDPKFNAGLLASALHNPIETGRGKW